MKRISHKRNSRSFEEKLNRRNSRKDKAKKRNREKRSKSNSYNMLAKKEDLHFLKSIVRINGLNTSKRKRKKVVSMDTPEIFSITENPIQTIDFIANFSDKLLHGVKKIIIDSRKMKKNDLAAEHMLRVIGGTVRRSLRKVEIRGLYPESEELKRKIRSVGIVKEISKDGHSAEEEKEKKLKVFHRASYQKEQQSISDYDAKADVVSSIIDHINNCLHPEGLQLTEKVCRQIRDYVGELIDNAEEHSKSKMWRVVGFYDGEYGRDCEIVIFNSGQSYEDSFKNLPESDVAKQEVMRYVKKHSEKRLTLGAGFQESELATVMALQGGVSSKKTEDPTRGNGTVELIQLFNKINALSNKGDDSPRMCLLSGRAFIEFNPEYRMEIDKRHGKEIMAFNSENDLSLPPDKSCVKNLGKMGFPGTMVALKFVLPNKAVLRLNDGRDQD